MSQASKVQTLPGDHEHTPQGHISGGSRISLRLFLCPGSAMRGAGSGSVQERLEKKFVKKFYAFKKSRKTTKICEEENVKVPWVTDGNRTSAANEP